MIITPSGHGLGYRRDSLDIRDHRLASMPAPADAPDYIDLRHSGFEPPIYDQSSLGCHDAATEVLTAAGWKPWADLKGTELLGTMAPGTHELEFQAPLALQRYDYDGPLHYADHQRIDFALTPNHRMYQRRWDERARTLSPDFSFREISDIGWYAGLPASTSGFKGTDLVSLKIGERVWNGDDLLAVLALVASDGWVGGTENNWSTVSFCCFRDDRYEMVAELAFRLGIRELPGRKGVWVFRDAALANWVRANLFVGSIYRSPFKRVPDIVKCASGEQIGRFLEFFGDQHIGKSRQFYSSSQRMIDDLQELLLRVGKRSGIYSRAPRSTQMKDGRRIEAENCAADITLTEWEGSKLSIEKKHTLRVDHYRGEVFCATVPNSTLVTRRNGSVLISGNSCTANAIAAAMQYARARQKLPLADSVPSRLMIYFLERQIEDTITSDAGAEIRDGIKAVASTGVCFEDLWPYVPSRFADKPSEEAYAAAAKDLAISYARVPQTVDGIRNSLAAGWPVIFGFTVYPALESADVARTGRLPMPNSSDDPIGAHAVLCVGCDLAERTVLVRNSWSAAWGLKGHFLLPLEYILNPELASDMWQISAVSS